MFPTFPVKMQSATKIVSTLLVISVWLAQQAWAQTASAPPATAGSQQTTAPPAAASPTPESGQSQNQPSKVPAGGITVNPSQAPLQPVTTYPDVYGADQQTQPGATPGQAGKTTLNAPQPKAPQSQPAEPQGAATAEKVPTAGG